MAQPQVREQQFDLLISDRLCESEDALPLSFVERFGTEAFKAGQE